MPTDNIFDILEKEHDKTRELFKQTESKRADHGNVFSRIRTELTMHMDGLQPGKTEDGGLNAVRIQQYKQQCLPLLSHRRFRS